MCKKNKKNWQENMLYAQIQRILCRKRTSMFTGLKVSSLTCKCVFYSLEHNVKRGSHGTDLFKILKCKNELQLQIELKDHVRKMAPFV